MLRDALALWGAAAKRIRAQAGFTMLETMVAAVILSAGVLGVFVMVETADRVNAQNSARATANSIARELLEDARSKPFATIGAVNWIDPALEGLNGRTGNVTSPGPHEARVNVKRDEITYAIKVADCTVDEARDGYGGHSVAANWCSDSGTTGAADGQPEDLKRVAVEMTWTAPNGKVEELYQTATFGSGGQVIGPTLTDLTITAPPVTDQNNPVITTNPVNPAGIVRFLGTSPGAADMKFFVEGVEQQTNVSGGNGSWTLDWNVTAVPDGVYSISAVAIDALGARGAPRIKNVRLARGVPTAPANITGGYNYVWVADVKTLAVELMWDASPDGSVTGYEVWKGSTLVCQASLETTCMDRTPATSGNTTYTIKTLYTDGAGSPASISNTYDVTAPAAGGGGALPTRYIMKYNAATGAVPGPQSTANCKSALVTTATTFQNHYDMVTPGWTATTTNTSFYHWAGCLPVMTSGGTLNAGTMIFRARFQNGNRRNACAGLPIYLYLNGTTIIAGTGINGGGSLTLPANSALTAYTLNFSTTARTFQPGDQLSIYSPMSNINTTNCGSISMAFNNDYGATNAAQLDLPLGSSGGGSATLTKPATPANLTAVTDANGNTELSWSPTSGNPEADFYRVYRDGQNYTDRVDTAGEPDGGGTVRWTDTDTGGTSHTYRVTAVSNVLAESDPAGPVTR
jgi:Tfp pilus assembly protein PilV